MRASSDHTLRSQSGHFKCSKGNLIWSTVIYRPDTLLQISSNALRLSTFAPPPPSTLLFSIARRERYGITFRNISEMFVKMVGQKGSLQIGHRKGRICTDRDVS
jgi:hypothetical protein